MAKSNILAGEQPSKRFYVYLYRDSRPHKDREPIYIGKGAAKSSRSHFHWKVRAANPFFAAILEKIRSCGLIPIIEIVAWFDDEAEAFALERALISRYGRRDTGSGSLTNLTDGGDGTSGYIPTDAERKLSQKRMKITRSKQWEDPQFRSRCLENLNTGREKMRSDADYQKRRSALRAETMSADAGKKAKQSAKMSASRKRVLERSGAKEKFISSMVSGRRGEWIANPEKRDRCAEKIRKATKASWQNPEFRENLIRKNSTTMKAKWSDPEYRSLQGAKLAALLKAAWADPEKRALMLSKRQRRKDDATARG